MKKQYLKPEFTAVAVLTEPLLVQISRLEDYAPVGGDTEEEDDDPWV